MCPAGTKEDSIKMFCPTSGAVEKRTDVRALLPNTALHSPPTQILLVQGPSLNTAHLGNQNPNTSEIIRYFSWCKKVIAWQHKVTWLGPYLVSIRF